MTRTAGDQADAVEDLAATAGLDPAIGAPDDPTGTVSDPAPGRAASKSSPTPKRPVTPKNAAKTHDARSGDTRERILNVALDLFTEQGFDGTSLRQIAEQLGVTKAALYYHFESKDDILLALHMRLHEFGEDALSMIGDEPVTLAQWGELLDQLLDQMIGQRKIFLMHERNQAALEKLHGNEHEAEHEDIQNRFRLVLADTRVPLRDRVRMAASFGAVFSGLFLAGEAFASSSESAIGGLLREVLHDIVKE